MKIRLTVFFCIVLSIVACRKVQDWVPGENDDVFAGGVNTVFDEGGGAFTHEFDGMSSTDLLVHETGDALFEGTFVVGPAPIRPGLGPLYNNVSCSSCHVADGRGKAPMAGESLIGMLIRVSIPGENPHGGPLPAPGFGGQLQQRSIFGTVAEANVVVHYSDSVFTFPDGENVTLRKPIVQLNNSYTTLPSNILLSARVAPAVFGLGLLEAIPDHEIITYADEFDVNGDGISGRPNRVWDAIAQETRIGRFGWKAGNPSLLQQTAGAFNEDMGITSFVFPQENSLGQSQHDGNGDEPEVTDSLLHSVAFYMKTLSVPAPRNRDNAQVQEGKAIFTQIGCNSCHRVSMRTKTDVSFTYLSNQLIFPYTDLLLHDMGPSLADQRPDFIADGQEWRTAPLWGIGLTQIVNGHTNFLHDGRARNFQEAILWHGGEASQAVSRYISLSSTERNALLLFLKNL